MSSWFGIIWDLTDCDTGGDYVALLDTKYVGDVFHVTTRRAKLNPRKWVVKKHGSHAGELDQKLKLTIVVHHDDRVVDEVNMT